MKRSADMGYIFILSLLFAIQFPVLQSTFMFLAFVAYRRNNV